MNFNKGILKKFRQFRKIFGVSKPLLDRPLVVVLGSTGSGKTKLSVEICKRFNGEVISTDSMQIYEGLDIATNKVTPEESCGVPHHMISFLDPLTLGFTVVHFRNRAVKIINELHAKNKLPVIVGGTNYYNEAILWKVLTSDPDDEDFVQPINFNDLMKNIPEDYLKLTNEQLHDELKKIDPVEAERVHPSKRRRVLRCLQHFYTNGRRISDDIKKQREQNGGSDLGGPLRFPNACVMWLQCDDDVLTKRLDSRVDEMITKGLRDEVTQFFDRYNDEYQQKLKTFNDAVSVDDSWRKGVFQCIGMKEFRTYVNLTPDERSSDVGRKAFHDGVERMKISTRQYAKYQKKWIANRFLRQNRDAPPVYGLNATNVDAWIDDVERPALNLVENFLNGEKPTLTPMPLLSSTWSLDSRSNRKCEICDRLVDGVQWDAHIRSNFHKTNVWKRKHKRNPSSIVNDENCPKSSPSDAETLQKFDIIGVSDVR